VPPGDEVAPEAASSCYTCMQRLLIRG